MPQTRRRGRPPRSATPTASATQTLSTPTLRLSAPATDVASAPSATRRLHLLLKIGLGQPGTEKVIEWPSDWELPRPGDVIRGADGFGGKVAYIEYHLDEHKIVVGLT